MSKDRNPPGATHYRQNPDGTRTHFILGSDHHYVWLGLEWNEWSIKLPYVHPHGHTFIKVEGEE